jgi:redox-sensitive bicupin YhaK (pirin superfamily)
VSSDGRDGSLKIHQDAKLYAAQLPAGEDLIFTLEPNRYAWVQIAKGSLLLNGELLSAGDGAAVEAETLLAFKGTEDAEILLFHLA